MTVTEEIGALITGRATASQIARTAVDHGDAHAAGGGLAKVRAGETSLAEVARVVS